MRRIRWIIGLGLCGCIATATARWADMTEAPVALEHSQTTIEIHPNGDEHTRADEILVPLNEGGRLRLGTINGYYNAHSTQFHVTAASTQAEGGPVVPVARDRIEDKPVASETSGFDIQHQWMVAFPRVEVGSRIRLAYTTITRAEAFPKNWDRLFLFGSKALERQRTIEIHSAIPLRHVVHDPLGVLDVQETHPKSGYGLTIRLKKPFYSVVCAESGNQLPLAQNTWVQVSTFESMEALGQMQVAAYEAVLQAPLPRDFETIVAAARRKSEPVGQITTVMDLLAQKVRYMGDWRTVKGQIIPRPLAQIAQSGMGDCKDFSASTVAMLRALGYAAHVAWVERAALATPLPAGFLPTNMPLNHAIVHAVSPEGQTFWLDPTNFTSMADGIYADIAGRPALILNPKGSVYSEIPSIDPAHARVEVDLTERWQDPAGTTVSKTGTIGCYGEQAISMTGSLLFQPAARVEETFIRMIVGRGRAPMSYTVTLPDLATRVVSDQKFKFSYTDTQSLLHTNVGFGVPFTASWSEPYIALQAGQLTDYVIPEPYTQRERRVLEGVRIRDPGALDFEIDTPWIYAKRRVSYDAARAAVIVAEDLIYRKTRITAADIASPAFAVFRTDLERYKDAAMIVEPIVAVEAH